jgi:hypothetical protein
MNMHTHLNDTLPCVRVMTLRGVSPCMYERVREMALVKKKTWMNVGVYSPVHE